MKIAISTIATGPYVKFLYRLLPSIREFMFLKHEIVPIVFGDVKLKEYIYDFYKIDYLPPPLNALLKFNYIKSINPFGFDMIFYIDGDCEVVSEIGNECIPTDKEKIVAVRHPWQGLHSLAYEDRPESTAYVSDSKNTPYLQDCFFGGYTKPLLKMATEIETNVEIDLKKNIIAKYFDESHFNKYLLDNPSEMLSYGYAYPDPSIWKQELKEEKKILHKNYNSILK